MFHIELTVNKRYITLAQNCRFLVGFKNFKLEDPMVYANEGTEGITVAILEKEKYPIRHLMNVS